MTAPPTPSRPVESTEGLFEREGEFAELSAGLRRAASGDGTLVLVEGPPGIGKTRLLLAARHSAEKEGFTILTARGGEMERSFGFGVVRQLLEPAVRGLPPDEKERVMAGAARLADPALGYGEPADPGGSTIESVLHGLFWLVANLAEAGPLLMTIDDGHWADPPSMRFLHYLGLRLEGLRALVVVAPRPQEPGVEGELIEALAASLAPTVLRPDPLSQAATASVIRSEQPGSEDPELIRACHEATGGNPFLLRELLVHLRERSGAGTTVSAESIVRMGPERIAHETLLRVRRIAHSAPAYAQAIAVLGEGAQLELAASLAGIGSHEASRIADALIGASILASRQPLSFVHPVVRTAIYEEIPVGSRVGIHARAADLLRAQGAAPHEIAAHLLLTEPTRDPQLVETLRAAAGQALASGAPESAVAYLRRAVAERANAPQRSRLMYELGTAEAVARLPTAIADLKEAYDLADDPALRAHIVLDLIQVLAFTGDWDTCVALADGALAEEGIDPETRLELEAFRVALQMYDVAGVERFERARARLISLAGRTKGRGALALRSLLADASAVRGEPRHIVLSLVEPAVAGGRLIAEWGSESPVVPQALAALAFVEDLEEAGAFIEEILADARRRGSLFGFVLGLGMRAFVHTRRGDLAAAEVDMHAVFEQIPKEQSALAVPATLHYGMNAVLERSGLDDAAAAAEGIELPPPFIRTATGASFYEARGTFRAARGELTSGAADLRKAGEIHRALRFGPRASAWRSHLALAVRGEDHRGAVELAEEELELAREAESARAQGVALRTLGLLHGHESGIGLLRQSLSALEDSPAAYERACTLAELGASLRRANHRSEARDYLRSALDLAHRCGAERLEARVLEELRVAGAKPRRPLITGRYALTPSELRVATAAAGGATNREIAQDLFVTLRTVEMHLSNTYRKLEISSRAELAPALEATI